jgi:hypothetical protein
VHAEPGLIVVLDGATARTETGCAHGVAWYAATLGTHLTAAAADRSLPDALAAAITETAQLHPECDLDHPATPSAAVAVVRTAGEWLEFLILGDTTVLLDSADGLRMMTDARVDAVAAALRAESDRYPFDSPEKETALLRMKHAELALRNQPGGFWVAAADPGVIGQAVTGRAALSPVRRLAVMTDGATRAVHVFGALDWAGVLDLLAEHGPAELIRAVRDLEARDPAGIRWPRNKGSDDATAVYGCR